MTLNEQTRELEWELLKSTSKHVISDAMPYIISNGMFNFMSYVILDVISDFMSDVMSDGTSNVVSDIISDVRSEFHLT